MSEVKIIKTNHGTIEIVRPTLSEEEQKDIENAIVETLAQMEEL